MGLAKYLRRKFIAPLAKTIDAQTQIVFEAHIREVLRSAPYNEPKRLEPYGFRSFSQNDEDGIIQEIFARIGALSRTFLEFGVQDGRQNNSLLLLLQNWSGLWIEADAACCRAIRNTFSTQIASGQLRVEEKFVSVDNINALIDSIGTPQLDLLSIDVDGNDYWIWEAVQSRPRVVICEYNAKFRPPVKWVMTYNPRHSWDFSDYHGASLQSLANLGRNKGYTLVGCCLAGVNAFFVRDDLVEDRFCHADVSALYNPPRYYMQDYLAAAHPLKTFGPFESL